MCAFRRGAERGSKELGQNVSREEILTMSSPRMKRKQKRQKKQRNHPSNAQENKGFILIHIHAATNEADTLILEYALSWGMTVYPSMHLIK